VSAVVIKGSFADRTGRKPYPPIALPDREMVEHIARQDADSIRRMVRDAREIRERAGIPQRAVASRARLSRETVNRIETKQGTRARARTLARYIQAVRDAARSVRRLPRGDERDE
jgi:DNA-binding XRE family transcriptional regulator